MNTEGSTKTVSRVQLLHRLWLLEFLGFASIIALSWLDEYAGLPYWGSSASNHVPNWREPVLETMVVIMVGAWVLHITRRISKRLSYLEGFVRLCSWCHRVDYAHQWHTIEDFLKLELNKSTTHGICPACTEKYSRTGFDRTMFRG
jgi:hypothetical protein